LAADDLDSPLGTAPRTGPHASTLPFSFLSVVTAALAVVVAAGIGWVLVVDDPLGGEPRTLVAIEDATKGTTPSATIAAPAPDARERVVDGTKLPGRTVTVIDGRTGERREVAIGTSEVEPEIVGTVNPRAAAPTADPRFVETSRHGAIPRVSPEGKRPLEQYARVDPTLERARGPRIAIVISGLGIGAAATGNAISKLPPGVTLAFAPYGTDMPRWAGRARGKGHELLLQLPMEPADYPDNDPGPQTLVSALTTEQNLDRLHWLLSRLQGYVGVMNLMGARFTANEAALSPILRDVAKRGLLYLDDGTAPKSVAAQIAGSIQAPFLKADLVVDTTPNWSEIDAALAKLEAIAAERGSAVGIASASPVAIERIARWAKAAEARGIRIVPLSVLYLRPKQQG
jgi:polysaccharide deacetylase 2 family uncharacterized protein YibQ